MKAMMQGKKVLCIKAQATVPADTSTLHAFLLLDDCLPHGFEDQSTTPATDSAKKLRRSLSGSIGHAVLRCARVVDTNDLPKAHTDRLCVVRVVFCRACGVTVAGGG